MLLAVSSGLSGNNRETNIYKVVEITGELSDIGVSLSTILLYVVGRLFWVVWK